MNRILYRHIFKIISFAYGVKRFVAIEMLVLTYALVTNKTLIFLVRHMKRYILKGSDNGV
jgi:hypothetical protein